MHRRSFLIGCAAGTATLALGAHARAAQPAADAGELLDVSVRLFTGYSLAGIETRGDQRLQIAGGGKTVTASILSADAASHAFDVDGAPFAAGLPLVITSTGPLAVTAYIAGGEPLQRRYAGRLSIDFAAGRLVVLNVLDMESYVASTLVSEIGSSWHEQALRAQAIAARTYALRKMHAQHPAPLTDDTSNQVYRGLDGLVPAYLEAAAGTRGVALAYQNAPAEIMYSSTCGGHTASETELSGRPSPPYLEGVVDQDDGGRAYCAAAPYFAWKSRIPTAAFARAAAESSQSHRSAQGRPLQAEIRRAALGVLQDVVVAGRWPDGRVKMLQLRFADGSASQIDGRSFYARAMAVLGYKVVPSTLFDITRDGDAFTLQGHGLGHGVGMCQWGARGRADAGQTAEAILAAYFPSTTLTAITNFSHTR